MWNKLAELATENLDKGMQIQVRFQSAVQSLNPEITEDRARMVTKTCDGMHAGSHTQLAGGSQSGRWTCVLSVSARSLDSEKLSTCNASKGSQVVGWLSHEDRGLEQAGCLKEAAQAMAD